MAYGDIVWVSGLFYGIKPAVVAIVLAAAVVGFLGGRYAPERFTAGSAHATASQQYGPAIIDDDTPTPAHALFSWPKLWGYAVAGMVIWAVAIGVLYGFFDETLFEMGWFFTKAALLTFGGAYAVLPYVYQGAVENYGWLSTTQMIDGLALGETTPGPLIMVVAFVGFVGGWSRQLFGPDALFLAGASAATVVTWFTFLPSFLFILAGGPLVESTHGQLQFTAPLTAITAAVVGVIINLAVFFAYHVLWPDGFAAGIDGVSVLIGIGAVTALFRYKVGVIPVILACAGAGLAFMLIRGA